MKRIIITMMIGLIASISVMSQNWAIQSKNGNYNIKAIDESGGVLDVVAMLDEGDDCFMDVKAIKGDLIYPIKMVASDSMYIPIAAITPSGGNLNLVGVNAMGEQYPVKGVSRFGNTIRIAIVVGGSFEDLQATSPDGKERVVSGVKFNEENIEMEIGPTKVIAHVKALPTMDVKSEETSWEIKATGNDGSLLDIVALNKKGREYKVMAVSAGGSFAMLNVKAEVGRDLVPVKLIRKPEGIRMIAVDYYGRQFPLKAKVSEGKYFDIEGGENCGKTIDIKALSDNGVEYLMNAISPAGDMYDLKGIKVKDVDKEGYLQGLEGLIAFYAHVKALPPVQ
jgi:hypothetical protein